MSADEPRQALDPLRLADIYATHRRGAWVRTGASATLWLVGLAANQAGVLPDASLAGISACVCFLIGLNPPTLWGLRRLRQRTAIARWSRLINLLEILGYTGILYFTGGVQASFLLLMLSAVVAYVGVVGPRRLPFEVAGMAAAAYAAVVALEHYRWLPRVGMVVSWDSSAASKVAAVTVTTGLLFVVAFIASYTAGALRHREERFRTLFEDAPVMYVQLRDLEGAPTIAAANRAFLQTLEYAAEEVVGRPLANFYTAESQRRLLERDDVGRGLDGPCSAERRLVTRTGRVIDVLLHSGPERDAEGRLRTRAIFVDLSERKAAEAAVVLSEARTRAILENMQSGLITMDAAGRVESANPAAARIFGYPREALIGMAISRLVREAAPGGACVGLRSDQSEFPLECSKFEFQTVQGRHFGASLQDLSERREVERLKKEFVATVSHELRTPLASIRGSLGLVAAGAVGRVSEEAGELIVIAERNAARLNGLIDDILDLERHEAGSLRLKRETLAAVDLVRRALETVAGMLKAQDVRAETRLSDVLVWGDADRLCQVLVNLLSNAAKFSPRGSTVSVELVPAEGGFAEFRVVDRGRGIPEREWKRVFEPFAQVEASDARKKGGTGLGLAICRAIVEAHGGTIGVMSQEGLGSRFWFRIPEAGVRAQPEPGAASRQTGLAATHIGGHA